MRWLTGSLNGAALERGRARPCVALVVLGPVLLAQRRATSTCCSSATTPPPRSASGSSRTRLVVIVAAVGLIAFATAAAGPIAFVAFLVRPDRRAARRAGRARCWCPSALVGALLVLRRRLLSASSRFGTRYPVGVVTGVLGAPYLIYLIVRTNRAGGSL